MMRARALTVLFGAFLLAAVSACGDDGKVGSSAPPGAGKPPTTAPSPTPPAPPSSSPTGTAPTGWAGTRAGDWSTWEIRAAGTDSVTRLTWRATRVEAGRITFTVESKTTAPDGRVLAETSNEEVHDAAADPAGDPAQAGAAKGDDMTVSGARLSTSVRAIPSAAGEKRIWTSASAPFSGVVRVSGGGVEQTLVGFGRGS